MKRLHLLSDTLLITSLLILFLVTSLVSVAFCQTSLSASGERELYYKPDHFTWVRMNKDQVQRQLLLPLLSRQQVVIALEQPTDEQKNNVEAFLRTPPETLPEIDTFRNILLAQEAQEYAVGYLQDRSEHRRPKTKAQAAAYLITFKTVQPTGAILKILHDLTHMPQIDFALPVFAFPGKTVTPYIQFDVEFLAPELILGGAGQIQAANSRSYVKVTDPEQGFDKPVVLQLQKDAPTNILATVLRYQQMPGIVKRAQLRWLRVRQPVEIQSRWASSSGINSFSIWESIQYILSIERDRDVELLPKAFTEGAVYTWLAENTHLPGELIQVDRIAKHTEPLENGRMFDEVSIWFRLSKTGTYIFTPYAVQAAFPGLDDQKRIETFRSEQPTFLTIPGHLPRQLREIPGELLALPAYQARPWLPRTGTFLGIGCLVVGIGWVVIAARRSSALSRIQTAEQADAQPPSLEAMKAVFEGHLKDVEQRLGSLTFHGGMEPERAWLRILNVYIKRLIGVRWYQDEHRFLGGLGTSSDVIKRSMLATAVDPEQAPLDDALCLVRAIDQQVMKQNVALSKDEAEDFYARAASLTQNLLA
ncbi:MAG: hypothetical protein ETSY1_38395 [Candidatus Entotheonella factor]|uniref:Uncharacterized protein n=1 Tax=Entotheonella factor TaxID=1429438 RepID=W4L8E2_ENTF1|nr:MAG: hypothetical protein ETSY1_38395 [Candidatus Entotheonella factor]